MPKPIEEIKYLPKRPLHEEAEDLARKVLSNLLGISLYKEDLKIFGKLKEFDLVNIKARIVGDVKRLTTKGVASAEEADMCKYVWLMEKLEASTGWKWRKIIVGVGWREIFERFARNYNPWLSDVEIYFMDDKGNIHKIRDKGK
jgi:hypothetical protein